MKLTDAPHVKVYQAQSVTYLPLAAYESITHALISGAQWWEGETLYGCTSTIRCASITDVHFTPQSALDIGKAEDDEAQWQPT